ncbi:PQQ-like beta-propeller repeat protein, partial [Candidatus Sumerlaeota bacterium]|nr:PQQ-like beta-propeller repeat protein [Candidatus Sumerlaeota bacterium]
MVDDIVFVLSRNMRRIVKFPLFAFGSFMAILVVIVGVMFLMRPYWDLRGNFTPTFDFESRERHYERLEASREAQKQAAGDEEEVQTVSLASSGASWSNYRGPNRDGISLETGLLQEWPEEGPPELYRQPVGGGYAGFVVGGGRVYTIEQRRDSEVIPAYDLETGRELWTYAYPAFFQEQMGGDGPRATPTLDGDRLYALGASGQLNCLDANTGEQLWGTNILEDAGTENLEWGMSGSPLIVDDRVMVTAAGLSGSALLAYDKASGELLWKALPGKQAYTSLMEVTLAGRRQLLNLASAALNGLDPETGELLWSFPWSTTNGINCSQPVVAGEDRIILS